MMESGARAEGDVLWEWIRMVRSGRVKPRLESLGNPLKKPRRALLSDLRPRLFVGQNLGGDPDIFMILKAKRLRSLCKLEREGDLGLRATRLVYL